MEGAQTYLGRFECTAHALSLLCLALLGNHCVVAGTCGDDHGRVGIAAVDSFVEHDVLRVVLPGHTQDDRQS